MTVIGGKGAVTILPFEPFVLFCAGKHPSTGDGLDGGHDLGDGFSSRQGVEDVDVVVRTANFEDLAPMVLELAYHNGK
ncbi:hypothetical protein A3850_017135 [Lewinella sp. 4G2]|nr:hypothetical protein A3850_017135 [Lewinella sp. 4G2]